jgi:hypothetical protein
VGVTLVAARVEVDYAEVLTDTLAFGQFEFMKCSKLDLEPHMDTAVTGRGPAELFHWWRWWRDSHFEHFDTLDALEALAPAALRTGWEETPGRDRPGRDWGQVIHVGWSDREQRFVANDHQSVDGFRPTRLPDFFVAPALLEAVPAAPSSDQEWVALAQAAYDDAGRVGDARSPFGGDMILTRLEQGVLSQRTLCTMPTDDRRYRHMLVGTLHRVGQLGPCVCGKGKPYLLCHLAGAPPSWPCPCPTGQATGKPFVRCHRVDPTAPSSLRYWREHADDFTSTSDALARAWQTHDTGTQPAAPRTPVPSGLNRQQRRALARHSNH